jgi:GT2 family glycosyltransferase
MYSVAIVVLNYNTAEMTAKLVAYLREQLAYGDKTVYVVDNGSKEPPECATLRLPKNVGFTSGMYNGYIQAKAARSYDAYWFLNSDVVFDHGDNVLADLVATLFIDESYAQISPQYNSPHVHMRQADSPAQEVAFLEPTATLVKASTIAKIGFWDLECTLGWGVDYDYGYRVRLAGMKNILTDGARITHKEHSSIANFGDYAARANAEMARVLTRKYGPNFMRITRMEAAVSPPRQAFAAAPRDPGSTPARQASSLLPGAAGARKAGNRPLFVCAIFRNEARYLCEWLEFHLLVGVEKFYLYQNRSNDHWQQIIQPYIEKGIVDLKPWPNTGSAQMPAYRDCVERLKGKPAWLAFIDIDEFLFSPKFATVTEALATLPEAWGAVGVHWMCFGASGRENYEPELVMKRFTWRPVQSFHVNTHIKTIARLDRTIQVRGDAHYFTVQGGTFNEQGGSLSTARPAGTESALLRINHYTTKSRQEYYDRIALGRVDGAGFVSKSVFEERQAQDVDDRTIWKFLPALQERLGRAESYVRG